MFQRGQFWRKQVGRMKIENAQVFPLIAGRFGHVVGGVRTQIGHALTQWPLLGSSRAFNHKPSRRPDGDPTQLLGPAVFGGVWYNFFGHFLTETLPALVAIQRVRELQDLPIVFVSIEQEPIDLTGTSDFWLKHLGIDPRRLVMITQPSVVSELHIPAVPFQTKYRYAAHVAAGLDQAFDLSTKDADRRLYISRSRLAQSKGRNTGEAALELLFAAHGFDIWHPQENTIQEQLKTIQTASVLAGLNGSALHWSLFAPGCKAVMCLGWDLQLQRGICQLRGQQYICLPGKGLSKFKGRNDRILTPDYVEPHLRRMLRDL